MRAFAIQTSREYWPRCQVLLDTISRFHPEAYVYVQWPYTDPAPFHGGASFVPGFDCHPELAGRIPEIGIHSYFQMVRPAFLRDVLKRPGISSVITVGADCVLYDDLSAMFEALESDEVLTPMILTPHVCSMPPEDGLFPSMLDFVRAGQFNCDVIGYKAHPSTLKFLDLIDDFFQRAVLGHTDQIWLAFALSFLPGTMVWHDLGVNAAYWNTFERPIRWIEEDGMGKWFVDATEATEPTPLRLYHYSGIIFDNLPAMSIYERRHTAEGDLLRLYQDYAERVDRYRRSQATG